MGIFGGNDKNFNRSLLLFVLGVYLAWASLVWLRQVPETRGQLLADIAALDDAVSTLTFQAHETGAQTQAVAQDLSQLGAKVSTLEGVDEKTKAALQSDFNELNQKLLLISKNSANALKGYDLTSIPAPAFSLIGSAEAAANKKIRAPKQDTPFLLQPANRILLILGCGLLVGAVFIALYASTKDVAKRKFYGESLGKIGTFLAGLATGVFLPNL